MKKRRRPDKDFLIRIIPLFVGLAALIGAAVCIWQAGLFRFPARGEQPAEVLMEELPEEEPELIEPVGSALSYERASIRELATVTVVRGVVCPATTEYTYDSGEPFGTYAALPGDTVHTGDTLIKPGENASADTIEEIEEANAQLLDDFVVYQQDYAVDLAKAKKTEWETAYAYQEMAAFAPAEDSPWYASWAKGAMAPEKRMKEARMARQKLEEAYKERQELFDLEYAYNETRIARIRDSATDAGIRADADGVVVALAGYAPGDRVAEGSRILATGDPSRKDIISEYVSKSVVNKSEEIYALIDGVRYEIQYEVMEPEEYRRRKQEDDDVYTTWHLADPEDTVPMGRTVTVVAVENRVKNALCVPKDAVHRDDSGAYVYLYDDGESVFTSVQTGVSDGAYTQILSGLGEGDPVIYDAPYRVDKKTQTLKKGEVNTPFSTDGYLYYPAAEWVSNPAKNVTVYLKEVTVERYEPVEEGQVVARISVVTDDIEIERVKRRIERAEQRVSDLQQRRAMTNNKDELESIDRQIRDRKRSIESAKKELAKRSRYSGEIALKAPCAGLVTDLTSRKAGDMLDNGEKLVQVSRGDSCFIVVEDKGGMLSYGDTATVTARTSNGLNAEAEGHVVSLNPFGLTKGLRSGYAIIKVSQEDMNAMTDGGSTLHNGYWARSRFSVDTEARAVRDVVLVPRSAVYRAGDNTYVVVPDGDGHKLVRFIAGGSDNDNYWVAYGDLEEGMTICSE